MRQLQPVIWSGHFTHAATFADARPLRRELSAVSPGRAEFPAVGISRGLEINQEALTEGNFALTRASELFAEGLPFEIRSLMPRRPKPWGSFLRPSKRRWTSFLPFEYRSHGLNVSIAQKTRT